MSKFPTYGLVLLILLTAASAFNNPNASNYFIGEFDLYPTDKKITISFPPGFCVKSGLFMSYVKHECSADHNTVTRYTYTTGDTECQNTVTATETFTLNSDTKSGYLGDFNCAGKTNVLGYKMYLGDCNTLVGIAWMATDICHLYSNNTNVSGNTAFHTDLPQNQYFQLTALYRCEGCTLTLDTYSPWSDGETQGDEAICPAAEPLTQLEGTPGCDVYYNERGFDIYADAVACIKDGINQFNVSNGTCTYVPDIITTDSNDSDDMANNLHFSGVWWLWIMVVLYVNCFKY